MDLYTYKNSRNVVVYIVSVVAMMIAIFPIYWILATALKTRTDFLDFPPKFFLFKPTLNNFHQVFVVDKFHQYIINSVVVTVGAVLLALLICIPASYSLCRLMTKGRDNFAFSILGIRVLPMITLILPLYILFKQTNLLNTRLGLILIYTLINFPLTVWVLRSFIMEIPVEIEEAAAVDGCSKIMTLLRVVIPLIKPGILAVAILDFMFVWNEYFLAYILSSATRTVPVATEAYIGIRGIRWGETCSAAITSVVPVVIILFFVQKHIVRGLSFGAVK